MGNRGTKRHRSGPWSERGQSLTLFAILLPLVIALVAVVIDGAHAFGHKRRVQNAADAAALAAAQELLRPECAPDPRACIQAVASQYVQLNLAADAVAEIDLPLEQCTPPDEVAGASDPVTTNCYSWPYYRDGVARDGQVEVRFRYGFSTLIGQAIGLLSSFDAGGRAVASSVPVTSEPTVVTVVESGTTETIVRPESTETITTPATTHVVTYATGGEGSGGQAFIMSRSCEAILYSGAGGGSIGTFATNGGLTFEGNADKRVERLGLDLNRCGYLLPQPPNGDRAACDATPTGGPGAAPCVRELEDLSGQVPLSWPIPPPPLPTPLPDGTAWNPAVAYPGRCVLLRPSGRNTLVLAAPPGPPGVYCVRGSDTRLVIATSMTAGDGYTFFGLEGARIKIASNGTSVRFYWPSACGDRPATRSFVFDCFGRTIFGYDPLTVLLSTDETAFPGSCDASAICFDGQGGSLDGDVFAPSPETFPPSLGPPPQGGGTVWIAGGAASAGSGFVEAWQLVVQGNGGTYSGTGPIVGGTYETVTTTTPATTETVTTPASTSVVTTPGSTSEVTTPGETTGTDIGLDE